MRPLALIRSAAAEFFIVCWVLRGPFIVAAFAFVFLAWPAQTHEVYRVLSQTSTDQVQQMVQIVFALTTLFLAGGFVWHVGRQITLKQRQDTLAARNFEGALLRWLPRLLGALVPLGAAVGLISTVDETRSLAARVTIALQNKDFDWANELRPIYELVKDAPDRLNYAGGVCIAMALLLVAATALRTSGKKWKYENPTKWLLGRGVSVCCFCLVVGFVLLFSFAPPAVPQWIGTVAIFNIFVVVLVIILSSLFLATDRLGVPFFLLLIVMCVGFALANLNDNHVVTIDYKSAQTRAPSWVDSSFDGWLRSRKDLAHYHGKSEPYPVFIVAAGGGGTYAAHHTATYLARMQDRCPRFAQHVFAISGVSGGSIGAAIFAAMAKLKAKNEPADEHNRCDFNARSQGPFERLTQGIFKHDFLAPVVASALFPDLLQRLIPSPIPIFDRSRALDASIENAWDTAVEDSAKDGWPKGANPLREGFLDLWHGTPGEEAVPALLLNTTEVANGYRVVVSPFNPFDIDKRWSKLTSFFSEVKRSADANMRPDIKLSTAAGISARFPWILPAATVPTKNSKMRLVDGGYFESSGVDTANDLIWPLRYKYDPEADRLRPQTIRPELPSAEGRSELTARFYLLVLMGYDGADVVELDAGESAAPIRTLISTWQSRAEFAFLRAFLEVCPNLKCFSFEGNDAGRAVEFPVSPVFLNLRDFKIPLAWQLTSASREIIRLHAGMAEKCTRTPGYFEGLDWTESNSDVSEATLRSTEAKAREAERQQKEDENRARRILKALDENSCSACLVEYKLANKSEIPGGGARLTCGASLVAPGPVQN